MCKSRQVGSFNIAFWVATLIFVSSSMGVTIDIDTTIDSDNSFPFPIEVEIVDGLVPPTVVDIVAGGDVGKLRVRGTSIVNVSGGTVEDTLVANSGRLNLTDGELGDDVVVEDTASLVVSGGQILETVFARDSSRVTISGPATLGDIRASGNSIVEITGGTLESDDDAAVISSNTSVVNIRGGILGMADEARRLLAFDSSTINVFGSTLTLAGTRVTGELLDGTPLDHEAIAYDGAQIVLHIVPEPAGNWYVIVALLAICVSSHRRWRLEGQQSIRARHRG